MEGEIARWRIAYDTVTALVAVDQSRTDRPPLYPSLNSAAAAAAGRVGGGTCAAGDAEPRTPSHRANRDMIQRQRWQQQQQWQGARLTQSALSTVSRPLQSHHSQTTNTLSTITSLPESNRFESAAPMTSLSISSECGGGTRGNVDAVGLLEGRQVSDGQRDDATRLVQDGEALVGLFRRLLDTFYMETMLWMYTNVLLHPAARRTRNRLHWLGIVTGRGLEQATSNVLTGFIAGYRQSRRAINGDVEEALTTTESGRAGRLAGLAVELGVVLNPREMMSTFSAVVRDLVFRTSPHALHTNASSRQAPPASRLYRYFTLYSLHTLISCTAAVNSVGYRQYFACVHAIRSQSTILSSRNPIFR